MRHGLLAAAACCCLLEDMGTSQSGKDGGIIPRKPQVRHCLLPSISSRIKLPVSLAANRICTCQTALSPPSKFFLPIARNNAGTIATNHHPPTMARVKKQEQPLKGCVIAFCGNFRAQNESSLANLAECLGARTVMSINKNLTHLVTTQTECNNASKKVIAAQRLGSFVVNLDWFLQSEEAGSKQPESNYALDLPLPAPGAAAPGAPDVSSKKRPASDSLEPEAKKSKLEDVKTQALGSAQVAKNPSSVVIPLDEGVQAPWAVFVDDDGVIWDATLK